MVRRPTIAHLAKAAGVSIATVDRVLNRRLPVREDTALRVVAAAEAIGYHATGLLKRRLTEVPHRRFGFLLQKRHDAFYQTFAKELEQATRASQLVQGKPVLEFMDELVPAYIAGRIREAGAKTDALAIVAIDHPLVNEAVAEIAAKGKPVFTLLSDITSPARISYLAADKRKDGRTAAWFISRMAKRPGRIGILVGSHRYLSQEMSEISFRTYIREHAPGFQLLEPIVNLEDERIAYEAVANVANDPDLVGMYVAGGGEEGLIRALRDENAGSRIIAVCNELTPMNRAALIDGTIDMVLDTPIAAIAARTVELMAKATTGQGKDVAAQALFPAIIYVSENV